MKNNSRNSLKKDSSKNATLKSKSIIVTKKKERVKALIVTPVYFIFGRV